MAPSVIHPRPQAYRRLFPSTPSSKARSTGMSRLLHHVASVEAAQDGGENEVEQDAAAPSPAST